MEIFKFMFGFKKLLERIKSLESYLSVKYTPKDSKDECSEHIGESWSVNNRLDKIEEQLKNLIKSK